ncbi:hypothetical protein EXIGLDRAFT_728792 [Exidia glandulosa HHB12029]|uniref:Uncharacterized protein n=1 Tax=Exidia glandulosa HHB12029 TaxID=1314781 RepID=A0A165CV27_EXIGL|nr:hypothetical protein EXIGLDRAFT_728792 [Exidia glandulosa HHB12029]
MPVVLNPNSPLHSAVCWAAIYKARVTIQRLRFCNLASLLVEYGGKPGCGKKSLCVPHTVALWRWSESCASSESFMKELEPLRAQCAVCQECEVVPAAAIFKELLSWADPGTEKVVSAAWDSVPILRTV